MALTLPISSSTQEGELERGRSDSFCNSLLSHAVQYSFNNPICRLAQESFYPGSICWASTNLLAVVGDKVINIVDLSCFSGAENIDDHRDKLGVSTINIPDIEMEFDDIDIAPSFPVLIRPKKQHFRFRTADWSPEVNGSRSLLATVTSDGAVSVFALTQRSRFGSARWSKAADLSEILGEALSRGKFRAIDGTKLRSPPMDEYLRRVECYSSLTVAWSAQSVEDPSSPGARDLFLAVGGKLALVTVWRVRVREDSAGNLQCAAEIVLVEQTETPEGSPGGLFPWVTALSWADRPDGGARLLAVGMSNGAVRVLRLSEHKRAVSGGGRERKKKAASRGREHKDLRAERICDLAAMSDFDSV
eukprot:51892_1